MVEKESGSRLWLRLVVFGVFRMTNYAILFLRPANPTQKGNANEHIAGTHTHTHTHQNKKFGQDDFRRRIHNSRLQHAKKIQPPLILGSNALLGGRSPVDSNSRSAAHQYPHTPGNRRTLTLICRATKGEPAKSSKAKRTTANTCIMLWRRLASSTLAKTAAFNEMVPWKLRGRRRK